MKLFRMPVTLGAIVGTIAILALIIVGACAPKAAPAAPIAPAPMPMNTAAKADAGAPVPHVVMAHPPPIQLRHRGVNLSGGEFGANVPGEYGKDYAYPRNADVDYFVARHVNHVRLPFRHERLQPTLKGPLDEAAWTRFSERVEYMTGRGLDVMIEPHNSYRHGKDCKTNDHKDARCHVLTETELGDFWGRVGQRFKGNPRVQINLTNEPHHMATEYVASLNNAALKELRRVGFAGLVLVPGNAWTGAGHWNVRFDGATPNAEAMLKVKDPLDRFAFEVHQYLDADASGGGDECVSATIGIERLAGFVSWLRTNGKTGFLGEIGAPNTPTCKAAIEKLLDVVEADYDVWRGWDWWSAGYRWSKDYKLSLQPLEDGTDRPQMAWLTPFLSRPCPGM